MAASLKLLLVRSKAHGTVRLQRELEEKASLLRCTRNQRASDGGEQSKKGKRA